MAYTRALWAATYAFPTKLLMSLNSSGNILYVSIAVARNSSDSGCTSNSATDRLYVKNLKCHIRLIVACFFKITKQAKISLFSRSTTWFIAVCGRPPNDCSACMADRRTIHFFSRHSKTVADRGIKSFRGRGRPRNTFGGLPRTKEYIPRSATHRGNTLFRGIWQNHKIEFTSKSVHFEELTLTSKEDFKCATYTRQCPKTWLNDRMSMFSRVTVPLRSIELGHIQHKQCRLIPINIGLNKT